MIYDRWLNRWLFEAEQIIHIKQNIIYVYNMILKKFDRTDIL